MADGSERSTWVAYIIFSMTLILAKPTVKLPSSFGPFFQNDVEWPNEFGQVRLQSYGFDVQNLTATRHPRSPNEDHSPLHLTNHDSQEKSEGWPKVEISNMVIVGGPDEDKAEQFNATSITDSEPNSAVHRLQRESNASAPSSGINEVAMIPPKVPVDSLNWSKPWVTINRTHGPGLQPGGIENRRGNKRKEAPTPTSKRTTQTESGEILTKISSQRTMPQVSYKALVTPGPEYRRLMTSPPNSQTSFSLASVTTVQSQFLVTSQSEAETTETSKLQTQSAKTVGTISHTTVTSKSGNTLTTSEPKAQASATSGSDTDASTTSASSSTTDSVDRKLASNGTTTHPILPRLSETLTTILTTFWDFRPWHTFRPLPTDDGVSLCPCPSTTEPPTNETDEKEEYETDGATGLDHGSQLVTSFALAVLLALKNFP